MPCYLVAPGSASKSTGGQHLTAESQRALELSAGRLSAELGQDKLAKVLCPPLSRAQRSAEIVAKGHGITPSVDERLSPGVAQPGDLELLVRDLGEGEEHVALVLQSPEMPIVLERLGHTTLSMADSAATVPVNVPPGTVIAIRCDLTECVVTQTIRPDATLPV